MNLAQMLNHYADPSTTKLPVFAKEEKKRGNPKPNNTRANEIKSERAQAKYREAMGTGWKGTTAIEDALGYGRSTAYKTLHAWEAKGLVERRNFGGLTYSRKRGYEWRWKSDY